MVSAGGGDAPGLVFWADGFVDLGDEAFVLEVEEFGFDFLGGGVEAFAVDEGVEEGEDDAPLAVVVQVAQETEADLFAAEFGGHGRGGVGVELGTWS